MPVPRRSDVPVRFVADGTPYAIEVPRDVSALRAVLDIAGHPRPAFRCESATCGTCEVEMNGDTVRLCSFGAPGLDGAVIVTPSA